MKDCEEHRYGKWVFTPIQTANGAKCKEVRSCIECGKSQMRNVERVEGDKGKQNGDV